jgi:hypothetical protein
VYRTSGSESWPRRPQDVLDGAAAVDEQRDLDRASPGQHEALALADQERHARGDALDAKRRLEGQDLVQLQGRRRGRRHRHGHRSQQQVKGYWAPAALYIASATGSHATSFSVGCGGSSSLSS